MGSLWSTSFRHLGGDLCQPPTIINQIGIPVETHSNFAHKYLCLWPHFAAFSRPLFGRFIRSKGDAINMCHRGAGSPGFIRGNAGCSREEQASRAGLGAAALRRQQPSRRQERCHERSGVYSTGCLKEGKRRYWDPGRGENWNWMSFESGEVEQSSHRQGWLTGSLLLPVRDCILSHLSHGTQTGLRMQVGRNTALPSSLRLVRCFDGFMGSGHLRRPIDRLGVTNSMHENRENAQTLLRILCSYPRL